MDKIEKNFMLLGSTEVNFFDAFADDVACSVPQVGRPKPPWKDRPIGDVNESVPIPWNRIPT